MLEDARWYFTERLRQPLIVKQTLRILKQVVTFVVFLAGCEVALLVYHHSVVHELLLVQVLVGQHVTQQGTANERLATQVLHTLRLQSIT